MVAMWLRSLSAVAVLLAAAGEKTCPRGAGKSCNAEPDVKADAAADKGAAKAPVAQADLISQEIDELKGIEKICDERIELLTELQQMVKSGVELSLPESHARILKEQLPLMSDLTVDHDKAPTGSSDDYLISKAVIPQEEAVSFIKFMPLKNQRASGGSSRSGTPSQSDLPTVLLVAVQPDGAVRMFSALGELISSFSAGHEEPVTQMAVSVGQDEHFVMTADASGIIRVHKVTVRSRRMTKEQKQARKNSTDEKISQYLGTQVNVTAAFTTQMKVPSLDAGGLGKLTSIAPASQQGQKYFLAGDEEGNIGVFSKNGTWVSRIEVNPGVRIEGLYSHLSNVIFRTDKEWGWVMVKDKKVDRASCPDFTGGVAAVAVDSQQASRVLVADEEGTVWIFNMKERKSCKVEHRFPKGATVAPIDLASIKGFTIALERAERSGHAASVLALNMSHVGQSKEKLKAAPSPVAWRSGRQVVRDWSVHKRHQSGDLLAFLSDDGREIEVVELLMSVYTAPSTSDPFGNFKMPVIAVAIVMVLGYQYMKNKGGGKGGKSGKFDGVNGMDFGGLGKSRGKSGGHGLSALRGLKGRGGFGKR